MTYYYITEPAYLTISGNLRGKSIRCFEATYSEGKFIGTGRAYYFRDGQVVGAYSRKSIASMWVRFTDLDKTQSYWRAGLFSSIESALYYKLSCIRQQHSELHAAVARTQAKLATHAPLLEAYSSFCALYPEVAL